MAGQMLFYYFGDDEAFYRALQGEFRRHAKVAMEFKRKFESTEPRIQSLFLTVFEEKPSVVFIDFSKHPQDYLHLARLLSRTPMDHKVLLVGLLDYLSPPEIIKESIATGLNLNYIKSAETFDVVFDVTQLLSPGAMAHGFATAGLKEEWEAGILCKIGYVNGEGVHIETDYPLAKGDRIHLNHHWLEKRIVPSKQMFVKDVSTINMFYQFKLNADLDFLFVDEFIPTEGLDPAQIQEKQKERDELILYHKKQLKKWIEANLDRSQEKKAKVLVVDKSFHFYQGQQRTDKHAYLVRCIPYFTDHGEELGRLRPQVIAFELDNTDGAKNSMDSLRKLIQVLKAKFTDLNPFIIVFNSELPSKELQQELDYQQVIAYPSELSVEVLVKMANIFEKKLTASLDQNKSEEKVFLKKNQLASVGEIVKSVTVVKLSESDMVFQSDFPFEIGTNLHLTHPVEMFVNIQPAKTSGKVPEFYGLIHCLGETQKKELRRYVNAVFFRDHDAQLEAESEEFKKLNEAKLNEKIDALKKEEEVKQEEANKKAEEEAAKNAEVKDSEEAG